MSKVKRKLNNDAAKLFASPRGVVCPCYLQTLVDASCYVMENFGMQAGLALGNIVGVLDVRTEEAGIVSELKAGSEEAFAWLIAKYHQPIFSLVARTIPDPGDAADLTQDIFIKIYRGIGGFNGDASLRTWIYRIALREASNQRRWWGRHKYRSRRRNRIR